MEGETTVTTQLSPLAAYFKRRAEFFENEATNFAIMLERAYVPTKPAETPVKEEEVNGHSE